MSQKITITTKIQKETDAIDKVEYQWHWNRIVLACFFLVSISACVFWALSPDVAANETSVTPQKAVSITNQKMVSTEVNEEVKAVEIVLSQPVVISAEKNEVKEMPQVEKTVVAQNKDIDSPVLEAKQIDKLENTVLKDALAMHTSTLIPQSHLSKISHGGSIDTDFVTRAVLTTAVVNKEPIDVLGAQVSLFSIDEQLFFFTEINNLKSQTVFHRWFFENTLMAEVELNLFSMRYRTYSLKKIMTKQTGNWRVELVNSKQDILASMTFHIK